MERPDWRAEFDAEVIFSNGGGLQAQGFRLDIPSADIDDDSLGSLFVRHLGLLMVGEVRVRNRRLLREAHKGSRGVRDDDSAGAIPGRRVVDLSHVITHGMVTYPGLPGPAIDEFLSREASRAHYAPGTEFSIGRISMVGNTGTYLDTPFHRFADGSDLAGLPLESTVDLDGLVVRISGSQARALDRNSFVPFEVSGRAVLVHTGWADHWGTEPYGVGHPHLTADAAAWLVEQQAALVGIDSVNIDATDTGSRPVHTALLAGGIPIVEHLRGLDALPPDGFRFHSAPSAIVGLGTWPVRAYAILEGPR